MILLALWNPNLYQQEPTVSYVPTPCRSGSSESALMRSLPVWDSDFVYEVPLDAAGVAYLTAEAKAETDACYKAGLTRFLEVSHAR